jgi:hypothetical protein
MMSITMMSLMVLSMMMMMMMMMMSTGLGSAVGQTAGWDKVA